MKVGLFFDCGQPLLEISVHSFLILPLDDGSEVRNDSKVNKIR